MHSHIISPIYGNTAGRGIHGTNKVCSGVEIYKKIPLFANLILWKILIDYGFFSIA